MGKFRNIFNILQIYFTMTIDKKCEMQVIGLIEPVFVEFDTYIMLLTPDFLIKFDHLFKDARVYENDSNKEYCLPESVKKAIIYQLDSDNSILIHHSERTENRKFKKYLKIILDF